MSIVRLAWMITVLVAMVTALLLGLAGYMGYAALSVTVGVCAAINLF